MVKRIGKAGAVRPRPRDHERIAIRATRWANPAPAVKDDEDEILHHKYMIIDGHTTSE